MSVLMTRQLHIVHDETIVQPFDWTVNAGEKWAVLGANGAGKSSLLHALLGVEQTVLPHIFLDNHPLSTLKPEQQARKRVWVPQRYDEPFSITVRQALNSIGHELTDSLVDACLDEFGLLHHQNAWVHLLSGGERQRLTWAMAAARHTADTQLWLLDEPLAAQDLAWQHVLLKKLAHLPCAVIAAVHDLNQVQQFATHILVLTPSDQGQGSQVHCGTIDEMMRTDLLSRVYGVALRQDLSADGKSHWWRV